MGQGAPNNIEATAISNNDRNDLDLGDFGGQEYKVIYRVMVENSGAPYVTGTITDFRTAQSVGGTGGTVNDHGALNGLGDDDHLQYSLVDGSRAFTGAVGGIDPSVGSDLTTRDYVDDVNIHKIDPPSVTQTYSGTIIENVTIDSTSSAFGTLVYRTTSGIYTEAIGLSDDTISTAIVVGSSTVLIEGFVRDDALYAFGGGNLGKKIYLSPTVPGETVVTIPSGSGDVVQIVGEVWDNTTILFRPNSTSVEIA
jgi:hypothetical protein